MAIARVGSTNIEYYVEGEGPPLLLIIGAGGNAGGWGEPFLELLRPHFQTIRFSHSGTGASDSPSGEVTMRTMADDAAGLLRQLGIERAHVLGLSMGGHVALELALNYREIVQGLILCGADCGVAHSVPQSAETIARI
jgi:pimeloyl-ACP methyl ester carboxylesterase